MVKTRRLAVTRVVQIILGLNVLMSLLLIAETKLAVLNAALPMAAGASLDAKFKIDEIKELTLPNVESFQVIAQRPLFVQGRGEARPLPTPATVAPTVPDTTEQISLLAVILAPELRLAVIRLAPGQETTQLREGQTLNGWTLNAIQPDHIELKQAAKKKTIYLSDTKPDTQANSNGADQLP